MSRTKSGAGAPNVSSSSLSFSSPTTTRSPPDHHPQQHPTRRADRRGGGGVAASSSRSMSASSAAASSFVLNQQLPSLDQAMARAEHSLARNGLKTRTTTNAPSTTATSTTSCGCCPHLMRYLPDQLDLTLIPVMADDSMIDDHDLPRRHHDGGSYLSSYNWVDGFGGGGAGDGGGKLPQPVTNSHKKKPTSQQRRPSATSSGASSTSAVATSSGPSSFLARPDAASSTSSTKLTTTAPKKSKSGTTSTTAAAANAGAAVGASSSTGVTANANPNAVLPRRWRLANPVHALHLASQFDTDQQWTVTVEASSSMGSAGGGGGGAVPPILYGDEQERLMALQTEGIPESWHPYIVHKVIVKSEEEEKAELVAEVVCEDVAVPTAATAATATTTVAVAAGTDGIDTTTPSPSTSGSPVPPTTGFATTTTDAGTHVVEKKDSSNDDMEVDTAPTVPSVDPLLDMPAKDSVATEDPLAPAPVTSAPDSVLAETSASLVVDRIENEKEEGSGTATEAVDMSIDKDDDESSGSRKPAVIGASQGSGMVDKGGSKADERQPMGNDADADAVPPEKTEVESPPPAAQVTTEPDVVMVDTAKAGDAAKLVPPPTPSTKPPTTSPADDADDALRTRTEEGVDGSAAAVVEAPESPPPPTSSTEVNPRPETNSSDGADPPAPPHVASAEVSGTEVGEPVGLSHGTTSTDATPPPMVTSSSSIAELTVAAGEGAVPMDVDTDLRKKNHGDSDPSKFTAEVTLSTDAFVGSPKGEGTGEEAGGDALLEAKPEKLPSATVTPPSDGTMTNDRYFALLAQEEQIRMLRKAYLYTRNAQPSKKPPSKRLPSIASLQDRPKRPRGTDGGAHNPAMGNSDADYRAWINAMLEARHKVNQWVFHYRVARLEYWRQLKVAKRQKAKAPHQPRLALRMSSPLSKHKAFGEINEDSCFGSSPDDAWIDSHGADDNGDGCVHCDPTTVSPKGPMMQCLDCLFTGTGPSGSTRLEDGMVNHFLATNHSFAVTCDSYARIFCFHCGDFVHHDVFLQERDRIDVGECFPWMGWKDHPVQRSFDALRFIRVLDQGIVWSGMHATYPPLVPQVHVEATRFCMRRRALFHGRVEEVSDGSLSDVVEFARLQSHIVEADRFRPTAPVGIYNLGNTCFMSAVLQCLIHCPPLQSYFLKQIGHNFLASSMYKSSNRSSNIRDVAASSVLSAPLLTPPNEICLASELDKVFLSYYGSSVGVDVLSVLSLDFASKTESTDPIAQLSGPTDAIKGEPLVPHDMLTAVWRCGGMSHLAGYDQRDAHEFLHGFLDILGKHVRQYRETVHRCINSPCPDNSIVPELTGSQQDAVKFIFEGTLRSVLLCSKCGSKRIQSEPFMSLSLPLSKEAQDSGSRREPLSVDVCMRHFITPENLPGIHCPTCREKTVTSKQHVVAKLPKVLCLHLKRFDASYNKKIEDFVSFPVKGLDMGPYLPHWCEVTRGVKAEEDASGATMPSFLYDLIGSVNHFGTLQSGHYVANVLNGGRWYHCNDAHVSYAGDGDGTAEVAKGGGAYLLFYLRR